MKLQQRSNVYLDEWLDSAVLVNLGLIHAASDTAWIAIDASDKSLSELLVGRSVVECLHDDGLATCVASAQNEHYLSRFHDFTHVWLCLRT